MRKFLLIIIPVMMLFLGYILYLNWPTKESEKKIGNPDEEEVTILTNFDFYDVSCTSDATYFCIKTIKDVNINSTNKDLILKTTKSADYLINGVSYNDLVTTLYWGEDLIYTAQTDVIETDSLAEYNSDFTINVITNRYLAISYFTTDSSSLINKVYDVVDASSKTTLANLGMGKIEINTINSEPFDGSYVILIDGYLIYYTYTCDQTNAGNYLLKEVKGTLNNGVFSTETLNEYNNTNSSLTSISC